VSPIVWSSVAFGACLAGFAVISMWLLMIAIWAGRNLHGWEVLGLPTPTQFKEQQSTAGDEPLKATDIGNHIRDLRARVATLETEMGQRKAGRDGAEAPTTDTGIWDPRTLEAWLGSGAEPMTAKVIDDMRFIMSEMSPRTFKLWLEMGESERRQWAPSGDGLKWTGDPSRVSRRFVGDSGPMNEWKGTVPFQKATPIYDTEAGDIVAIVNNEKTIDGRPASGVLAAALDDLAQKLDKPKPSPPVTKA